MGSPLCYAKSLIAFDCSIGQEDSHQAGPRYFVLLLVEKTEVDAAASRMIRKVGLARAGGGAEDPGEDAAQR